MQSIVPINSWKFMSQTSTLLGTNLIFSFTFLNINMATVKNHLMMLKMTRSIFSFQYYSFCLNDSNHKHKTQFYISTQCVQTGIEKQNLAPDAIGISTMVAFIFKTSLVFRACHRCCRFKNEMQYFQASFPYLCKKA